ncbi:unnamed protein product, partial [Mesorhabditis spiculigera]
MRYCARIPALLIWFCLLALGSTRLDGFRHKLPADVEKAKAQIREVRRIFGLVEFPWTISAVDGDERLYRKGVKLIPNILRTYQEFWVDRCPDPITQEQAKIWVSHSAFVLDAYLEWERGNLTGKPFPYEEVDGFLRRFRDIYESMQSPELFDVKSLNITKLKKGSANASFEGLFEQMETQHGPLNDTSLNGCYWTQHILDSNFRMDVAWSAIDKIQYDLMVLERAMNIYLNNTGTGEVDAFYPIFDKINELGRQSLAMRYPSGIPALLTWSICVLQLAAAAGSISRPRDHDLRQVLSADYDKVKARVNDLKRIFGLEDWPYLKNLTGGDKHLYEKGIKLIPGILEAYEDLYVDRCPNPITREEARIWAKHRAFVLDAYVAWSRGDSTGKPFPSDKVDAFFQQFRDIYDVMPNPELFHVKSLNITELDMGSAEASFETLFDKMENEYFDGPINAAEVHRCYWRQLIFDNKFDITAIWPQVQKMGPEWMVLSIISFVSHNHTADDLHELWGEVAELQSTTMANQHQYIDDSLERARARIRDVRKIFGLQGSGYGWVQVGGDERLYEKGVNLIPDIVRIHQEFYVNRCPDPIPQEEAKIWVSQRAFVLDAYLEWERGNLTGKPFPYEEVDAFFRQFRDIYESMQTPELFDVKPLNITELNKGSANASFEGLFEQMETQHGPLNEAAFNGCYWTQHILDSNFCRLGTWPELNKLLIDQFALQRATFIYKNHTGIERGDWFDEVPEDLMRYPSGIPALLTWSICLLQLAADAGSISRPRDHDLRQVLSADYDKVNARVNDLKRIFGLDDWPHAVNLSGGDERLYEKGIKLIPDILEAYEELFVDRCRDPITKDEAKIWAEHKAFVLDAFLAWDRRNSTGKPFPYGEVDAFFQEFRDIYDVMPNPELFDVKSLNIPELDMGSAEASFEALFDKMEDENFHGPINATAVHRCFWRQLIFDNNFAAMDIWPHLQKMGPDVGLLSAVTHLYHNHTGKDPEALMTPVYELQMITMMLLQRNMAHTFEGL